MNAIQEKNALQKQQEKIVETVESEPDERQAQIRVRPYAPGDFMAMYAIWIEAELHPYTEIEVARLLASGGGALVAEMIAPTGETAIVGTLLWSHNGQNAWLWKLAVAKSYRHQGIARRMLRQVEQDVTDAGLAGVGLLTRETNTAAQSLYTREGWKQSAIHQFWGKRLVPTSTEIRAEARTQDLKTQKEATEC